MIKNCKIAHNTTVSDYTNLYGCQIDDNVFVGPFVEIQKGSIVGENSRISSHSFICEGVIIGKNCFIGHGVMFINDKYTEKSKDWELQKTYIGDDVRIGSNATILPIRIGKGAIIGAGSVVTIDVPAGVTVMGNPAREK